MKKRLLSLLLALTLVMGLVPFSALAEEGEESTAADTATTATVSFTAQAAGAFLCAPQVDVEVSGDLSVQYGLDSDSAVTVLDVLLRAHEIIFGDDFTKETMGTYLTGSASWISSAFGGCENLSFAVNGSCPNDGVWNDTYYAYTGYAINQAQVKDGDFVELFCYQDSYWGDNYVHFTPSTITAETGGTISLTLSGYCYAYYNCSTQETINSMTGAIEGAQLAWVDASSGKLTPISGAITDANGTASVTAPPQKGTYYLTAYMADESDTPCFMPLQEVAVEGDNKPTFDTLNFLSSSLVSGTWTEGTFSAATLEYDIIIKSGTTTKLTLQKTTSYDTNKYTAIATYIDGNGATKAVEINSGKITYLEDIPFGGCDVTITISDKTDPSNKTVYIFHVTRPRDSDKYLNGTNGIVLQPVGRDLLSVNYNKKKEGTMFQAKETGEATTTAKIVNNFYNYRAYVLNNLEKFTLTLTSKTGYSHLRYSTDNGTTWTELSQGGGTTNPISFPEKPDEGNAVAKVLVQVLDDASYTANTAAGKDGFAEGSPNVYTIWVEQIPSDSADDQILTASTPTGDWYPSLA